MKVVHLVPAMEQGGVESVVCDLNRALAHAGEESVVVSKGGRLAARIEADGGRHVALNLRSKNPLTYFSRAFALRRLLRREKPDLVCAHSRVPAWLFVWANRGLGLKWITYAHGANSVSRYSEVMTRGDLVVAPSRFLADYLQRSYGTDEAKIRIIHNAVDEQRFDPARIPASTTETLRREWGIAADDFVVMSIGRITPVKGFDALIKAVGRLRAQIANVKCVIVGGADDDHQEYLMSLEALVTGLGLSGAVVFAGARPDVSACLSAASVVVSANTTKPESFGLSMAEALAMGKPVVAKAFGGALEIIEDGVNGVLVRDDDFASAIARARDAHFGGLRDSAVSRFSFGRMAGRTLAVYRELAG